MNKKQTDLSRISRIRINPRIDIPLHQVHKSKRDIEDRIEESEFQQELEDLEIVQDKLRD